MINLTLIQPKHFSFHNHAAFVQVSKVCLKLPPIDLNPSPSLQIITFSSK